MNIRRGDQIIVIAGKEKGKIGRVTKVDVKSDRVYVEGVGLCKKAVKPNPSVGIEGGLVDHQRSIHASNVAIFNPESGKKDKVGFDIDESGTKTRVYRSTKKPVEVLEAAQKSDS